MASRLVAASILAGSLLLAGLAAAFPPIGIAVAGVVAISAGYVASLAWRGWRVMRGAIRAAPPSLGSTDADTPFVTVVVPARDEAGVIGAVVRDLALQVYPPAGERRFEVILVDDGSSDGTADVAMAAAGDHADPVRVLRREPNAGHATRGAALQHAMGQARGDVIVAIDADARVAPDFVARAIRGWQRDPQAAGLQVLRRPTNADHSWLTDAQATELLIDMANQCGRWGVDGAAELRGNGMFVRRRVLDRLGGWGEAALTEDLDLSTRLAAAGERVVLAPEVVVGEEAVETIGHLWHQRLRWAEGSMRRVMEHGPALLGAPLPIGRKIDFISFLPEFAVPPLMVASLAAWPLAAALGAPAPWLLPTSLVAGYGLATFLLALAGLSADGRRGLQMVARAVRGMLFLAHWLPVVPAALLRIAVGSSEPRYVKTPRAGRSPAVR